MRVLFLTTGRFAGIQYHGIYSDLLREFAKHGHDVYIVSSRERRDNLPTELKEEKMAKHLLVKTGNLTKTKLVEKGISTLMIEHQYKIAIKKYFSNVKFDLVMYSTPPITFASVVSYIKKRDDAKSYLLLKDIFPQNAIDLGMMSEKGLKGILYRYFREKEKKLYELSDGIGCMSQANVTYVLKNNPEVSPDKMEICPNCIEVQDMRLTDEERIVMREKYDIPRDKKVFVYGGNLGKPQGISFIIECLRSQENNTNIYFLVVGEGTEYGKLETYINQVNPQNVKLMKQLPKCDYDRMIAACDVGMIFLDHRFTIPNFPSRLLAYMQARLPVLACTDRNTDIGEVIVNGGFGWWCESDDLITYSRIVDEICMADCEKMGKFAWEYLQKEYSSGKGYEVIMRRIDNIPM